MKLSRIILENKKYIARVQIDLSEEEVKQLSEAITLKLEDYLDIENKELLQKTVSSAINELIDTEL
jgi:hypothetical protein